MGSQEDEDQFWYKAAAFMDRPATQGHKVGFLFTVYPIIRRANSLDSALQARINAVEAILQAESVSNREQLLRLRELLKSLHNVDLARSLTRIQYSKVKSLAIRKS